MNISENLKLKYLSLITENNSNELFVLNDDDLLRYLFKIRISIEGVLIGKTDLTTWKSLFSIENVEGIKQKMREPTRKSKRIAENCIYI